MARSANPGLIRPPLVHLAAMVAGAAAGAFRPAPLGSQPFGLVVGVALVVAGIAIVAWCKRTLAAANTPLPGGLPTTAIVRTGPYGRSRNPIYVAFALVHAGTGLCLDSAWILAALAPALLVIGQVVVPREERYLEEKFGDEYRAYKAAVRRWV
ncbi:MAG TPA: isoprenylcysteine carboxylmethyltransferase family protein [Burkholderiales bacterium]|nr:isoprenylcysteine carboxylmethyltransferase family protein [Burkholderiales bacterium]